MKAKKSIHAWRLDETQTMLECHLEINEEDLPNMEEVKSQLKKLLHDDFGIFHSTLEFEFKSCEVPEHGLEHTLH